MKKYKAYFELYGKKLQIEKSAESESHLKRMIEEAIIFHKIEQVELSEQDKQLEQFTTILAGMDALNEVTKRIHPNPSPEILAAQEAVRKPAEFMRTMLNAIKELGSIADDQVIPSDYQDRLKQMAKDRGIDLD